MLFADTIHNYRWYSEAARCSHHNLPCVWLLNALLIHHYSDVIMSTIASQITSLAIVYSTVYSGADQRKYQISASLVFVRGIHRSPVYSTHKGPVTRKMLPFDDVIMWFFYTDYQWSRQINFEPRTVTSIGHPHGSGMRYTLWILGQTEWDMYVLASSTIICFYHHSIRMGDNSRYIHDLSLMSWTRIGYSVRHKLMFVRPSTLRWHHVVGWQHLKWCIMNDTFSACTGKH